MVPTLEKIKRARRYAGHNAVGGLEVVALSFIDDQTTVLVGLGWAGGNDSKQRLLCPRWMSLSGFFALPGLPESVIVNRVPDLEWYLSDADEVAYLEEVAEAHELDISINEDYGKITIIPRGVADGLILDAEGGKK